MSNMYNTGIEDLGTGVIAWGTNTINCYLIKSTYTFDADHDNYAASVSAHEISQAPGGQDLDNCVAIVDDANNEVSFDADDEVFTALGTGDTPAHAVLADSATGQLLCCCTLTTPPAPNGADYTIQWNAEGVFEISN